MVPLKSAVARHALHANNLRPFFEPIELSLAHLYQISTDRTYVPARDCFHYIFSLAEKYQASPVFMAVGRLLRESGLVLSRDRCRFCSSAPSETLIGAQPLGRCTSDGADVIW
jgi:hypothetical protein